MSDLLWQATSTDALAYGASAASLLLALTYAVRSLPVIAQRWIAWRRESESRTAETHAEADAEIRRTLADMRARLDRCEQRHAAAEVRATAADDRARAALDDVSALAVEVASLRGALADAREEIVTLRAEVRRKVTPPGGLPVVKEE